MSALDAAAGKHHAVSQRMMIAPPKMAALKTGARLIDGFVYRLSNHRQSGNVAVAMIEPSET